MPTIGQIAKQAGVRPSAVRYYESRGLLSPAGRSAAGYRVYDQSAVAVLQFIRRAQATGIVLSEVGELLSLHRAGTPPCSRLRELARRRARELDARIQELSRLRDGLASLARRRPLAARPGEVCPMIERGRTSGRS